MSERVQAAAKKPEAKRENKVSQTQKTSQSISSPEEQILFLQRTIGNQAVGRLLKSGALQAKLRVGLHGDIYEQEADGIAEQVNRMPDLEVSTETKVSNPARNNSIQRKCPGCNKGTKIEKEEKLQPILTSGQTPVLATPQPISVAPTVPPSEEVGEETTPMLIELQAEQPVDQSGVKSEKPRSASGIGPQGRAKETRFARGQAAVVGSVEGATAPMDEARAGSIVAVPVLDTNSPEALLTSLATAPASLFAQTLGEARAATPQIQAREKADLEASFPLVERPTGLPRRAEKPAGAPTQLPSAAAPEMAGASGREGEPIEARAPAADGPVPGSDVSTVAAEPVVDEEDSGSWWDWLVDRVSSFFSRLPTIDTGLSTSIGPRPQVDITGEADPAQNAQYQQTSDTVVATQWVQADVSTTADFGENSIYPTVPTETLHTSYKPTPPSAAAAGGTTLASDPGAVSAAFDENMAPQVSEKVNEQLVLYRQGEANYQRQTEETRTEGERQIVEETESTITEQEDLRQEARGEVEARREQWREENHRIQKDYATQSQAKRTEIDQQIDTNINTAEMRADQELTRAEGRAEAERKAAETQAADEKRKAENRPRSWWERFKGAVSDAFAAIEQIVNDIFDALRALVREIIEAAKAIVRGIIEAARIAIVSLIRGFGEAIKALVSIALIAFPDAASRAREWIDGKVNSAVDSVNQVAEALKTATNAILDWIGATLDVALAVLQAAMVFALDVLEFLAVGFLKVLELLAKLQDLITNVVPIIKKIVALIKDPTPVIEAIKAFIGGMIEKVPKMAIDITRGAITFSPPPANHWDGIWSHLEPKLDYLAANWWTVIKQTLWHMVWPFAEGSPLWKDASDFWNTIKLAGADISAGNVSKGVDDILRIIQLASNIIGLFYGWVALGLIVGYAIAGGVAAVEVGVVPGIIAGAAAGAAIAGEVGIGLAIAMLIIEGGVIAKAGYNLIFRTQNADENEADYERIAGSGLTMAIIGAMFAIGWLAKLFAGAIMRAVFGRVFKRPALRGRGTTARGDIIEIRVALAARVLALLRGRTVTWLEAIRRNFPVIDLVEDGVITITARPKRAPLYRITGGRLISVKSSTQTGAALQSEINGWVNELSTFNVRGNVSVVNPSGRTLTVALQTPVDAATGAAMRTQAGASGVNLQLTTALPPGHPAGVFIDQIPAILAEAGVEVSNEVPDDTIDNQQRQQH